ncbi:VanZ family protein [Perlabentimonas gracilis]|uniref:VanZ family protein n=1 Tax=Perlabentimonas gracilis TaxID=2715279 RepID=UPI00140E2DB6|nr:VanZ family protein [Perlabentimonas gracilis]NHB68974.1 VanZ family protein [Perlabentimonas gracilis]
MKALKYWRSSVWTVIIILATTLPSSSIPKSSLLQIPHFDKLVHFVLFFVLALFILSERNSLRQQGKLANRAITFALSISIAYGLIIELLQYFLLPTRSGSLYDFMANVLGAIMAVVLYRLANRITAGWI